MRAACALGLLLAAAAPAGAQSSRTPRLTSAAESAIGFQGGASVDPEQAFVGVWWQTPEIGNRFHLRPGIDGGFGNDVRLATIHLDFLVRFPLGAGAWELVQGGGPIVTIARSGGQTDVGGNGSYVIGFAHADGFFTEIRVGGGSGPNLKFGAGWAIAFD